MGLSMPPVSSLNHVHSVRLLCCCLIEWTSVRIFTYCFFFFLKFMICIRRMLPSLDNLVRLLVLLELQLPRVPEASEYPSFSFFKFYVLFRLFVLVPCESRKLFSTSCFDFVIFKTLLFVFLQEMICFNNKLDLDHGFLFSFIFIQIFCF